MTGVSEAEGLGKPSVSRILRLALLTPDIVEGILTGSTDQGMVLEQLERPLPARWEVQRQQIGEVQRRRNNQIGNVSV